MNKKILYIFITFLLLFISVKNVYALDCSDVGNLITEYNEYKEQLDTLDCENPQDQTVASKCNEKRELKNLTAARLMQLNDDGVNCELHQSQLNEIVRENENNCSHILDDDFTNMVNNIMKIFYIIGPILLIIFGVLDYSKVVVSSEKDALKKANQKFLKRIIATIVLFLSPALTKLIISLNISDYSLSGNAYSCNFEYTTYVQQYETIQVEPPTRRFSSARFASTGIVQNGYTLFNQGDSRWSSQLLLGSNRWTIGNSGCAITSVAMQIVNSGVETTGPINPSTFNDILKNNGQYVGAGIKWAGSSYATNGKFVFDHEEYMAGNISDKASKISEYLSQGYYPVLQVKSGGDGDSHFVAVFSVENGIIKVGDPAGGKLSDLNSTSYSIATRNMSSRILLYRKLG